MKVRIISGEFGGRLIDTPTRRSTHVMGDRVRSGLFNMIDVAGAVVLDAFAGSGALGLEAISRGAKTVIFVEKDRAAARTVVKNTTLFDISKKTQVTNTTVENWMATTDEKATNFDIIFADPPYHKPQFSTTAKLARYLKPNGLMILSISARVSIPTVEGVVVVDKREYGEANLIFYQRV
ncbi:MAG: 16S rRNA (guanine(966)-N(2))-methyltransferase RsmD [Candidatus Nomurabacteria bacterium]|jgi:16S rRNA (guanine966-N2)-methyltransferase|nr:16S rRNA (guanine(966)-N(2))-methyltransferase RsmD [Candidatus Nomurabacteria bacterium]